MSKDYKELVEQITDELWVDLSYTPLDFDNREDCAKNIISIILKDVINDFLYDLRESYNRPFPINTKARVYRLIQKYEEEFKNVERL